MFPFSDTTIFSREVPAKYSKKYRRIHYITGAVAVAGIA